MSKKTRLVLSLIIILVLIPISVYLCSFADRRHFLTSSVVILLTLAAFFLKYEAKAPDARELVVIAVMCALAVASRAVFMAVPHFKPTLAVIMITGIAFGPEAGFLVGAVTALASNFIFGQGAWTAWQMFSYGMGGLLAGTFAKCGLLKAAPKKFSDLIVIAIFGFLTIILVVGPLLDTSTLFIMSSFMTNAAALSVYAAGFPINLIHAAATLLTLLLAGKPLLSMLGRIKTKYGI